HAVPGEQLRPLPLWDSVGCSVPGGSWRLHLIHLKLCNSTDERFADGEVMRRRGGEDSAEGNATDSSEMDLQCEGGQVRSGRGGCSRVCVAADRSDKAAVCYA
ncbi:hypothetical protein KUCAC02_029752, partial [Chaenocephalus aceratus]